MVHYRVGAYIRSAVFVLACALPATAEAAQISFFSKFPEIDRRRWQLSDGWTNGDHQSCEWRADALSVKENNIVMTLSDRGGKVRPIGCAEMRTNNLTGYGLYEARMRTAAGSGLNTAFFTYVGPPTGTPEHDEIDFEFLGKDPTTVEITHWVKGKPVEGIKAYKLGFDASKDFHDYGIEWMPMKIRWFVDGKLVHETAAGQSIPRNPTRIYLSLWSGSKMQNDWMGPFEYKEPVTAEVAWVKFTPME